MDSRQIAAAALMDVERDGSYSNLVLEPYFRRGDLPRRDRAFCSALFYGVLERRITLDWTLSHYSRVPVLKMDPAVRAALRLGAYQLMYMPSVPPAAAVGRSVETARALGAGKAAGFVNGVLRAMSREGCRCPAPKDKLGALSVEYSVPGPLIQLWRRGYGHETALEILEGTRGPAPVFAKGPPPPPCGSGSGRRGWRRRRSPGCRGPCGWWTPARWGSWPPSGRGFSTSRIFPASSAPPPWTPAPAWRCWTSAPPRGARPSLWPS